MSLFVISNDGTLVELSEKEYDSEDLLQELLAKYPRLMPGDEIDSSAPRRWLLITREIGVPDEADGGNRWSLDHLFVDQDGVPTLVEVKRSSDTRIRREVVGQMLDYAANAVRYWPIEEIRSVFERRCEQDGKQSIDEVQAFLGTDAAPEEFWGRVKTNLQAGKIRLLFVSDVIPAELRRIVEFLNEQMDPAEVLAIEVRQYAGEGMKTLIPKVFGQTAQAEQKKAAGGAARTRTWDEASFFSQLAERNREHVARVARTLFDWAAKRLSAIRYGSGPTMASFIPQLNSGDGWFCPFRVYTGHTDAYVEIPLGGAGTKVSPFDAPEAKLDWVRRLNAIPGISIADDIGKYPSIRLQLLAEGSRVQQFLDVMEWAVQQVEAAASRTTL